MLQLPATTFALNANVSLFFHLQDTTVITVAPACMLTVVPSPTHTTYAFPAVAFMGVLLNPRGIGLLLMMPLVMPLLSLSLVSCCILSVSPFCCASC